MKKTRSPFRRLLTVLAAALAWAALSASVQVGFAPPCLAQPSAADDSLRITGTVPAQGEPLTGRNPLIVIFDRYIASPKTADGASTVPLFSKPSCGGVTWGTNYIVYAPYNDWPNDQIIQIRMNPLLKSADGHELAPAQRNLAFATFVFRPSNCWAISTETTTTVLGISFPRPVNLADLRERLSVTDSKRKPVKYGLSIGTNPKVHQISLANGQAWPVIIRVLPGLTDSAGQLRMIIGWSFSYEPNYTPPPQLSVQNCDWGEIVETEQSVRFRFNMRVSPEDLANYVRVTDISTTAPQLLSVKLTPPKPPLTDEFCDAHFSAPNPYDIKIRVEVLAGAKSRDGVALQNVWSTELAARTDLKIENSWWSGTGREGLSLDFHLNSPVDRKELEEHLQVQPSIGDIKLTQESNTNYTLAGEWEPNQSYTITIQPGVHFVKWATLRKPSSHRVQTPEQIQGYVGFAQEGKFYFPRHPGLQLALETRFVDEIELKLCRMFPSNIQVALQDIYNGQGNPNLANRWSQEIATRNVKIEQRQGKLSQTPLELDTLLPKDQRGVFYMEARDRREGSYQSTSKIVVMTDVGVLSHWQGDELVLFAHDLFTLDPINNARVTVYSDKNQLLGTAKTTRKGMAHFRNLDKTKGQPRVAVVEKGEDYTFLELQPRNEERLPFTPGMDAYDQKAYDGFLYADRNLYRPGDPVHLRWIVRQNYGDAVPKVPLLLTVLKPNGKSLLTRPVTLSEWGTGNLDLTTQKSYPTGQYTVDLDVPGANKNVGSYTFQLEEFVPNRIKAKLEILQPRWVATDTAPQEVRINAQHLFGKPAEKRRATAEVLLSRGYASAKWPEFRFENDTDFAPSPIPLGEQTTDQNGNALFRFSYAVPDKVSFPMKATVLGRVYELGGRLVNCSGATVFFPSDLCLGIRGEQAEKDKPGGVEEGEEGGEGKVRIEVLAMRPDETPATDVSKVEVVLEKQVWNYHVRRYYTHHEPTWSNEYESIETREVDLKDGRGSTVFAARDYGYYRVTVRGKETRQFSTLNFHSYYGRCRIVSAKEPSLIQIKLDKQIYEPGDEALVRIESPFDGKGIVVIQGETIREMIPVDIVKGAGEVRLKVPRDYYPNVWVEASVIHAIDKEHIKVYPFSSFAVANLSVMDPDREVEIAFPTLPKEVRPAQPFKLEVMAKDSRGKPAEVEITVAAVDEGIHSIKGYDNPDPLSYFGRDRRPDLRMAHYYDKVAYDFDEPTPGGDRGEGEMGKRLGRPTANWIKTVALWSGVVRTGKDGRASIEFLVPEFTGQLRIVAVACNKNATGSKADFLFVRRPYMLQTSMPRFLLPGDTTRCRAVLYNTTSETVHAEVRWRAGGTLVAGEGMKKLSVAANGEADLLAEIRAADKIGQGFIEWKADILDATSKTIERLAESAPVPVTEPSGFQSRHEVKIIRPGETLVCGNTVFMDDDLAEIEVILGAHPSLMLQKALRYVVSYPYGCVEQTTSRLLPLYLLRKTDFMIQLSLKDPKELDDYIRGGIDRLFSMQTASGGLGYWPGSNDPYRYGSIYALHCLTVIRNGREFEIPEDNFSILQDYVRKIALSGDDKNPMDLYERAYAVYVLSLAGDKRAISQIERFDNIEMPQSARFLLAAALARNTKDTDRVKLYLSSAPSKPYLVRELGGSLNSDIRNFAVELLSLSEMGGKSEDIRARADKLIEYLQNERYGTTQEYAFVLASLCDYFDKLSANIGEAAAAITGPEGEASIQGRELFRKSHTGPGGTYTIKNTGKTELYVNVTSKGVPKTPPTEEVREGVAIRRHFLTNRGVPYNSNTFRHGESYVVDVEIHCERKVENLIVVDLLPAGFEVENPRLNVNAQGGIRLPYGVTAPNYLEIRDERLVLAFDRLERCSADNPRYNYHFYYVVNAVTPGEFQHPAVEAECMYDGRIRGASLPSEIQISGELPPSAEEEKASAEGTIPESAKPTEENP